MDTNRHEFFNAKGGKGAKVTSVGFNHEVLEEHEGVNHRVGNRRKLRLLPGQLRPDML
jgi:hypothetical protein